MTWVCFQPLLLLYWWKKVVATVSLLQSSHLEKVVIVAVFVKHLTIYRGKTLFKNSFLQQSIQQVCLYNNISAGTAGRGHVSGFSFKVLSKLLPKSLANEVSCIPPILLAAPGLIVWGQFIYKSSSHGICYGEGTLLCQAFALLAESLHT